MITVIMLMRKRPPDRRRWQYQPMLMGGSRNHNPTNAGVPQFTFCMKTISATTISSNHFTQVNKKIPPILCPQLAVWNK